MREDRRIGRLLAALACGGFCALGAAAAEPVEAAGPAGRWKGAILFEEGRTEVDVAVILRRLPDGGWTAVLDLPEVEVEELAVDRVQVAGDRVELRFDLGDGSGERTIAARLHPEGERMEGTFTHGLRTSPLLLERATAATERRAELEVLADVAALRERFRADDGKVRLVLLLAPS